MNYMFNNKEKWQRFTDWKGWKWVYWGGMMLGLYLFIGESWNLSVEIAGEYGFVDSNSAHELFLRRPFYYFFAIKGLFGRGVVIIVTLCLPCLLSLFFRKIYFYKILFVITFIVICSLLFASFISGKCEHVAFPPHVNKYEEVMKIRSQNKLLTLYCDN